MGKLCVCVCVCVWVWWGGIRTEGWYPLPLNQRSKDLVPTQHPDWQLEAQWSDKNLVGWDGVVFWVVNMWKGCVTIKEKLLRVSLDKLWASLMNGSQFCPKSKRTSGEWAKWKAFNCTTASYQVTTMHYVCTRGFVHTGVRISGYNTHGSSHRRGATGGLTVIRISYLTAVQNFMVLSVPNRCPSCLK